LTHMYDSVQFRLGGVIPIRPISQFGQAVIGDVGYTRRIGQEAEKSFRATQEPVTAGVAYPRKFINEIS